MGGKSRSKIGERGLKQLKKQTKSYDNAGSLLCWPKTTTNTTTTTIIITITTIEFGKSSINLLANEEEGRGKNHEPVKHQQQIWPIEKKAKTPQQKQKAKSKKQKAKSNKKKLAKNNRMYAKLSALTPNNIKVNNILHLAISLSLALFFTRTHVLEHRNNGLFSVFFKTLPPALLSALPFNLNTLQKQFVNEPKKRLDRFIYTCAAIQPLSH